jgi:hypothetical protein
MPNDIDDDPLISHAIADGWQSLPRLFYLPRSPHRAGARFLYFGAM